MVVSWDAGVFGSRKDGAYNVHGKAAMLPFRACVLLRAERANLVEPSATKG